MTNRRRGVWSAVSVLGLAALAGCLSPLEAPSAFTGERYLCGPDQRAELDARVEECRQANLRDGSCTGILSLRGVIDSQPVVVDAPTVVATYTIMVVPPNDRARDVFVAADAPYFLISLHVNLLIDPTTGSFSDLPDGLNMDILNVEARGGNYLSILEDETIDVQVQAGDELRLTFKGRLNRGGSIDGCFHAFLVRLR